MKVFLWDQREQKVESRELLRRAVLRYLTQKQNTDEYRESKQDSLFEFTPAGQPLRVPGDIRIAELPGGKPCVVDEAGNRLELECSVTHTGDWWLCVIGDHPVGIDGELRTRTVNPALARRICREDERDCDLIWLWTRKEAYVKYLGTGIKEGLKTFSVMEKEGFRPVDLNNVSEDAAKELEVVVYCPEEEIESVEWLK